MWHPLHMFRNAHRQTKIFILMWLIYMLAIVWTTVQAYTRLTYNRTDFQPPVIIKIPTPDHQANGPS